MDEQVFHWAESTSAFCAEAFAFAYLEVAKETGAEGYGELVLSEGRHTTTYVSGAWAQAAKRHSEDYFRPEFREEFLKESAARRHRFRGFFERTASLDLGKLGNARLAGLLQEYRAHFSGVAKYFYLSQAEFTQAAHAALVKGVEAYFPKADVPKIVSLLLSPDCLDKVKHEERGLLEMALRGYDAHALKRHSREFGLLFYNSYDEAVNCAYLEGRIGQLEALRKWEIRERIRVIDDVVAFAQKRQEGLLKKIGDPQTRHLAMLLRDMGVDRLELKDSWAGAEYRTAPLFREIAARIGVPFQTLMDVYRFEDAERGLAKGIKLGDAEAKARRRAYIFIAREGRLEFHSGEDAEDIARKLVPHHFAKHSGGEVKGMAACPGFAEGPARVVSVIGVEQLLKDVEEFKEGEVLVTTMTQPNMVVLARKAVAIVTNEGGVTSHAAVIARELGIPCIVGTKTATKAIKTGDWLEVDADNGVVKIIGAK